jgi:hypothetical protein
LDLCPLEGAHSLKSYNILPLASDQFVSPAPLVPGNGVVQRFQPIDRLEQLSVKFVTFARTPSSEPIAWAVAGSFGDKVIELGAGTINPESAVTDWGDVVLPLSLVPERIPEEITLSLKLAAETYPVSPVGIPLYKPGSQPTPAEVAGKPVSGAQLQLRLYYVK